MSTHRDEPLDPLEPADLARLLARAETDPRASEELDLWADVAAAAELERERLQPARPAAAIIRRPWLVPLAASILFAVALGLWFARRAAPGGAARLAELRRAPPYVVAELRAPGDPPEAFQTAMSAYSNGDWPSAVADLGAFLANQPDHGPARFYRGAAREQLGELEGAAADYASVAEVPDPLLAGHARLRLALVHLASGERERAHDELAALAREPGELQPTARALLTELFGSSHEGEPASR